MSPNYRIFSASDRPQGDAPPHANRHQGGEGERPQVLRGVHYQREGSPGGRTGVGSNKHKLRLQGNTLPHAGLPRTGQH